MMVRRILFLVPTRAQGGVQNFLRGLAEGLSGQFQCRICITAPTAGWGDPSVTVVDSLSAFSEVIEGFRPDLVVSSNSYLPMMAKELPGSAGIRFVEIVQSNKNLEVGVTRYSVEEADHVVFVSESAKRHFYEQVPAHRSSVIWSGVELGKFCYRDPTNERVGEVLLLGRLDNGDKSVFDLVASAARAPDGIRFRIVGEGPDAAELEQRLRSSGLSTRVVFEPWTQNVDQLVSKYHAADVVLSLSRSEGFGLVLAEAAAAGVPILLRSCGGVSDLFTHAVDAMFFESVDDLVENLRRLDPLSARVGIARAARKLTEDHLDRERMLSEYQKLFSAL